MNQVDAQNLVHLREYVIKYYKTLDGKDHTTSVVNQHNVAHVLESVIKSLDDLILKSGHVKTS
jgi:hypothetical protein|tara:strand:+ start:269 stop:457 length:189 start_codon:yes stop_codon:yes gene_type:complete